MPCRDNILLQKPCLLSDTTEKDILLQKKIVFSDSRTFNTLIFITAVCLIWAV